MKGETVYSYIAGDECSKNYRPKNSLRLNKKVENFTSDYKCSINNDNGRWKITGINKNIEFTNKLGGLNGFVG